MIFCEKLMLLAWATLPVIVLPVRLTVTWGYDQRIMAWRTLDGVLFLSVTDRYYSNMQLQLTNYRASQAMQAFEVDPW